MKADADPPLGEGPLRMVFLESDNWTVKRKRGSPKEPLYLKTQVSKWHLPLALTLRATF
jgi:hypothetical protein